jgi:hypothetical protein
MRLPIPFVPFQVAIQRRPLRPMQLKLWVLMILVMLVAITISIGVLAYRRREPWPIKATSTDPAIAVRQEVAVHGVRWGMSLDAALEQAKAERSPVLIYFAGLADANSRLVEQRILSRPDMTPWLSQYVTVQLFGDRVPISSISPREQEGLAAANSDKQIKLTGKANTPCFVVLSPEGEVVAALEGYLSHPAIADFLSQALARFFKRRAK